MNALKYFKACEQMSETQWLEFCCFWRIIDDSETQISQTSHSSSEDEDVIVFLSDISSMMTAYANLIIY
jgi:hypothetical protein